MLSSRLPAVNLQEHDWIVREGQAIWRLPRTRTEIAGEVLVATKPDGRAFVQFTKSPFPLVVAQSAAGQWDADFPPRNKHYAGRGKPPRRIIWLYLPWALSGRPLPANWAWGREGVNWRLENMSNGEAVEGYFNQ